MRRLQLADEIPPPEGRIHRRWWWRTSKVEAWELNLLALPSGSLDLVELS